MNSPDISDPSQGSPSPIKKVSRYFISIWLMLLMVAAVYVRISAGVNLYHLSSDELFFYYVAKGSTLSEVIHFSLGDAHPPLYMIFLHYWIQISDSVVFMRSLNVIFGVLLIPFYYLIGKQIDGRFAGMMSALFVTFSYGLIVQSYLLRDYMCLLFFFSLCFYWMLRWHAEPKAFFLCMYAGTGLLACLSHFTGLTAVFSLCVVEAGYLVFKRAGRKSIMAWLAVNAGVAALVVPIYYQWEPVRTFLKSDRPFPYELMRHVYYSPLYLVDYLLPMPFNVLMLPMVFIAFVFLINNHLRKLLPPSSSIKNLLFPLTLMIISCVIMVSMYLSNITPINFVMDSRHHLWLAPLIVPVLCARLACYFTSDADKLAPEITLKQRKWAIILLVGGFISYVPFVRMLDGEYMMKETTYQSLEQYLKSLDSNHLIIADRNVGFVIIPPDFNPYAYFSHWGWADNRIGRIVPLGHTHILLDAIDMRLWDGETLSQLYAKALAQGLIGDASQLVFIRNGFWSAGGVNNLIVCNALKEKEIKNFSSQTDISSVIVVTIPRKVFETEVISAAGKAHACLK